MEAKPPRPSEAARPLDKMSGSRWDRASRAVPSKARQVRKSEKRQRPRTKAVTPPRPDGLVRAAAGDVLGDAGFSIRCRPQSTSVPHRGRPSGSRGDHSVGPGMPRPGHRRLMSTVIRPRRCSSPPAPTACRWSPCGLRWRGFPTPAAALPMAPFSVRLSSPSTRSSSVAGAFLLAHGGRRVARDASGSRSVDGGVVRTAPGVGNLGQVDAGHADGLPHPDVAAGTCDGGAVERGRGREAGVLMVAGQGEARVVRMDMSAYM